MPSFWSRNGRRTRHTARQGRRCRSILWRRKWRLFFWKRRRNRRLWRSGARRNSAPISTDDLGGLAYRDVGQPRFFLFSRKRRDCRFPAPSGAPSPACPCGAGTTAFGNRTRSQPRQRGCSRGLGCYPNKQRNRHLAATPDVCFEHLWEQMHCLPSSATADSQALLLIIFLLLFHQSGITKELFPGRNSQFVVDILVVKL